MAFFATAPKTRRLSQQVKGSLRALERYLPSFLETMQDSAEELDPRAQALALDLYQQNAPEYAKTGREIAAGDQLANVAADRAAFSGGGEELILQALAADRLANPEFYSNRETAGRGFDALIAAQDPSKLSGAELAETERGLNRMNSTRGNINVTDATTTAANAGAFGSKLADKQARFGQALSLFPGISAASRSPINTTALGTGRSGQVNPASGQFNYTPSTPGRENVNPTLGAYSQNEAMRTQQMSIADQANNVWGGIIGPVCGCYIFREYYGLPDVPWYLRMVRDFEYKRNPRIKFGYKRMAMWLVPLMRRNVLVRYLTTYLMIFPLAYHAQYRVGLNEWGRVFKPFKWFWLKVWSR